MKHTPGPWIIKDDDLYDHVFTQSKPHRRIACVYGGVKGSNEFDLENQANARLIAAAPEMFRLLHGAATCGIMGQDELNDLSRQCRALISKVTDAAQTSAIGGDHGKTR